MKILAFSDLHHSRAHAARLTEASTSADLVIGAGDFCNMGQGLDDAVALLEHVPVPMIVVPGNAESADELRAVAREGTSVLHGEGIETGGLKIFGLGCGIPVTPFGDWSCDLTEAEASRMLDACEEADILVTHSPPMGVADMTSAGISVGSIAIRDAIERIQPDLALCGHIHESWGQEGYVGRTRVRNLGPGINWFEIARNGRGESLEKGP